nr:hypothetical protein [Rhizobium phaseoli]
MLQSIATLGKAHAMAYAQNDMAAILDIETGERQKSPCVHRPGQQHIELAIPDDFFHSAELHEGEARAEGITQRVETQQQRHVLPLPPAHAAKPREDDPQRGEGAGVTETLRDLGKGQRRPILQPGPHTQPHQIPGERQRFLHSASLHHNPAAGAGPQQRDQTGEAGDPAKPDGHAREETRSS